MVKLQLNDLDNQCHCNWITGCISSNNKVIFVRWDFPSFFPPRCNTLHGQTIISLSFFSLPPFVRKQFPSRLHTCFIASWKVKFTKRYRRPIRAKQSYNSVALKSFTHDTLPDSHCTPSRASVYSDQERQGGRSALAKIPRTRQPKNH